MSWCRPECASALMGVCGWEGEGNRSILPRKIVAKTGGRWWTVLPQNGFILQQDDSPAYSARVTEDWLKSNCSDFITKDKCLQFTRSQSTGLPRKCWNLTISCSQTFPSWKTHCNWSDLLRNPLTTLQWKTAASDLCTGQCRGGHFEHKTWWSHKSY